MLCGLPGAGEAPAVGITGTEGVEEARQGRRTQVMVPGDGRGVEWQRMGRESLLFPVSCYCRQKWKRPSCVWTGGANSSLALGAPEIGRTRGPLQVGAWYGPEH